MMDGTETERRLGTMLFDDSVQVLSTFELNQIASLTYGDESCDQIFEMLENCMAFPLDFPVLTVQKALVIAKHTLVYGSEKCVNSAWGLGRFVHRLTEFNTVLWAQQQQQQQNNMMSSWWSQIKGGNVDRGFPVREEAEKLHKLLQSKDAIQQVRHDKADPNSLVPIGDNKEVGFVSDHVRLHLLRRRMEEQELIRTKSNLAKANSSFGAGYQSKDGKMVVGAAHSMEEMLARAQREQKKYADTGPIHTKPKSRNVQQPPDLVSSMPPDLLDFNPVPKNTPAPAPAPVMDLLDMGSAPAAAPAAPAIDIFAAPTPDPFGAAPVTAAPAPSTTDVHQTSELLSMMTVTPAAEPTTTVAKETTAGLMGLGLAPEEPTMNGLTAQAPSAEALSLTNGFGSMGPPSNSVMSSNVDRFAALDALAPPESAKAGSVLSGLQAENRILSFSGDSVTANKAPEPTIPDPPNDPMAAYGEPYGGINGGIHETNDTEPTTELPSYGGLPGGALPGGALPGGSLPGGALPGSSLPGTGSFEGDGGMGGGLGMGGNEYVMGGQPAMPPPMPPSEPPPLPPDEPPPPPPGSVMFDAERYGSAGGDVEEDGFVMGGGMGAGLGEPMGAAPAAPPPPPPGM